MDILQILAFAFIAFLLVASPGPNGLLIAKTVCVSGKKAGFANVLGFLLSFYLHGALSVLGVSILLMKSAELFFIVKVIGAIYLAWIGVKSLIAAFHHTGKQTQPESARLAQKVSVKKSVIEGFVTNALNPKVSMFYLAAFPQFIPATEHAFFFAFLLVSIHACVNVVWFSAIVMLFSRFAAVSVSETRQRLFKGLTGVIFIGFGAKLLTLDNR